MLPEEGVPKNLAGFLKKGEGDYAIIDDWKQWAQEFLVLLEEAENAEQEGKSGDTAEQSARRKELEVELKTEPGYLALRRALVHESA